MVGRRRSAVLFSETNLLFVEIYLNAFGEYIRTESERAGAMIWVDYREKELIAHLDALSNDDGSSGAAPPFRTANLPVGDVVLTGRAAGAADAAEQEQPREADILCIIERKTVMDMAASIRDGRYEEQAYRLNDTRVANHQVIYAVEGDHNRVLLSSANRFSKNRITPDVMYAAFASILFFKGFSLYNSTGVHDTASFIVNAHRKLHKELFGDKTRRKTRRALYYSNDDKSQECGVEANDGAEAEYNQLLKKKRSYASNECVSVAMLCQIPGVSTTIANVLVAQFGTVGTLASRLNERPGLLDEWRYAETTTKSGAKGKGKRLSKPMVAAIKDALLPLLAPQ